MNGDPWHIISILVWVLYIVIRELLPRILRRVNGQRTQPLPIPQETSGGKSPEYWQIENRKIVDEALARAFSEHTMSLVAIIRSMKDQEDQKREQILRELHDLRMEVKQRG